MTKKTRYLLILIGFIIFILAAPLVVMYVRGISYDFKDKQFIKTGILAIRTDPKSAAIYLDGEKERNSSGDIKFLIPKEYTVTVKKDGYFDWTKRLEILPGQVTWASPVPNKLYMFLSSPAVTDISSDVLDFFVGNNSLVYLTRNSLSVSSLDNVRSSQNFSLPKNAGQLTASTDGKIFVLTDPISSALPPTVLIFDQSKEKFTDISHLFSAPVTLKFSGNGRLYALENGTLYRIDWEKQTKTPVKSGVKVFAFREDNLYYIGQNGNDMSLFASQSPEEYGTLVINNVPSFTQGEIFVDYEKQVLLLLDNSVYEVGSTVKKLADNVTAYNFNYFDSTLIFSHSGELSFYNPFRHGVGLITRSSSPITDPQISLSYNHVFFINDNKLKTLEMDTRDHQNEYTLYQGQSPQKFMTGPEFRNVYLLDNGALKQITIR